MVCFNILGCWASMPGTQLAWIQKNPELVLSDSDSKALTITECLLRNSQYVNRTFQLLDNFWTATYFPSYMNNWLHIDL